MANSQTPMVNSTRVGRTVSMSSHPNAPPGVPARSNSGAASPIAPRASMKITTATSRSGSAPSTPVPMLATTPMK